MRNVPWKGRSTWTRTRVTIRRRLRVRAIPLPPSNKSSFVVESACSKKKTLLLRRRPRRLSTASELFFRPRSPLPSPRPPPLRLSRSGHRIRTSWRQRARLRPQMTSRPLRTEGPHGSRWLRRRSWMCRSSSRMRDRMAHLR